MGAPTATVRPATRWVREQPQWHGVRWEALEAHVFLDHPEIQLLLRVRGRVLPWKGVWYFVAFGALALAGTVAFVLGPDQPEVARAVAGVLVLTAIAAEVHGFARALRGYGTGYDTFWGAMVLAVAMPAGIGVAMVEEWLPDAHPGNDTLTTVIFWGALVAFALGFSGMAASTLSPDDTSSRYRQVLDAVAALPEEEQQRLRADQFAALTWLRDQRRIDARTFSETIDTPLGGLTATKATSSSN